MGKLIVLKTFTTRLEAEIAKGALNAHQIQAMINADDEGGASPFPLRPTTRGVELLVKEEDAKKASLLLKLSQKG